MRLTAKLRHAAEEALGRRDRTRHPDGAWDRGGRWYPDHELACCADIRRPSRAFPWSLAHHCRTVAHVAAERGYPVTVLRSAVKRIKDEIDKG